VDQTHPDRAQGPDGFKALQCGTISVDVVLRFTSRVPEVCGVEKKGRNACIDHGCLEGSDTRYVKVINDLPGGKQSSGGPTLAIVCGVKKRQRHLGPGKRHTIELKVTGFLHLAVSDRHLRQDGRADVGLPDPHGTEAIGRHPRWINQATGDGKRANRCRQVAAIARPVHQSAVDRHLAKQVVHIVVSPA